MDNNVDLPGSKGMGVQRIEDEIKIKSNIYVYDDLLDIMSNIGAVLRDNMDPIIAKNKLDWNINFNILENIYLDLLR